MDEEEDNPGAGNAEAEPHEEMRDEEEESNVEDEDGKAEDEDANDAVVVHSH